MLDVIKTVAEWYRNARMMIRKSIEPAFLVCWRARAPREAAAAKTLVAVVAAAEKPS